MASIMADNSSTFAIPLIPQTAILDTFFPGFSILSNALYKYLKLDLTLYMPWLLAIALLAVAWQYTSEYLWNALETHFMSTADIRIDDEMYNWLLAWVADQRFAKESRRFVANTNLNSRCWYLWRSLDGEDEGDNLDFGTGDVLDPDSWIGQGAKAVRYTPSFGTHYFWYKKHLLLFNRIQNTRDISYGSVSEKEEISISCFGRNPTILKELLAECRTNFSKNDENCTLIYRGTTKSGSTDPTWTRCMSRVSRPLSTVVLDESVKQALIDDMRDYLHPLTRRWYSNRGIPYRRGYLLCGPAGTGKSSFSLAVAGYFKLKIYIVSLNSISMNEENLGTLFAELPKRCVVLLEDIDTAGLTHTREGLATPVVEEVKPAAPGQARTATTNATNGGISLSALLNVIDGVASQEGRVLIMTTNHIEKLDKALIRPGRVDMTVKFDLASKDMIGALFRSIFATVEGDLPVSASSTKEGGTKLSAGGCSPIKGQSELLNFEKIVENAVAMKEKKEAEEARISSLAEAFAAIIPSHTFSPAEIQGYLLKHKRDPEKAIVNTEEWVGTTLVEKKDGERKLREVEAAKAKFEGRESKSGDGKAEEVHTNGVGASGVEADEVTTVDTKGQ
jgi:chaperone BCS1